MAQEGARQDQSRSEAPMSEYNSNALTALQGELKTKVVMGPLLVDMLEKPAGGFMNAAEALTVRNAESPMGQLIGILLGKGDKEFATFCEMLRKSNHCAWAVSLKQKAESLRTGDRQEDSGNADATPIVPEIKADYLEIKRTLVRVCTAQKSPTLKEVKDLCLDLLDCVFQNIPRMSGHANEIWEATTIEDIMRIVCFRLSNWLSYDFLKMVIAEFQPILQSIAAKLACYENKLKPLLLQKLGKIKELQQNEEAPQTMAELEVKYSLNQDGLLVKELITERDFLAQRLCIPPHLLQVLSWRPGSVSMTYWIVRDVLPLAELALCRTIVREELITHGVEAVYLDGCPLLPGPVDHSLQSVHLQRRAIVAVIDAHHKDLDVNLLASDLKDMGIFTTEQCQKLTSLDEKDRRHDALLYSLLAHEEPDMYHRLVKCVGQRNASIAADLQATFMDLTKPPGALSVGSSQSTYLMMDDSRRKALRQCQQDLRMLIRVNDFLPSLHVHARGFLNDVESDSIRKHKGYVKQVDELIDILVTKENKDFDHFCIILEKNGHHVSSEKLRKPAGLDSGNADATPIVPEIKADYLEIKRTLVRVCTAQKSPTLKEVKDLCLDLLDCVFQNIPRMSGHANEIWEATTIEDIMRIVCFRLSNWLSYDFLKMVIAEFQPILQSIAAKLACYENKLKPLLLQKLGKIKELQQNEEAPQTMAELEVKYSLNQDGLLVKELITERDFLAQRLCIPPHLLQVLSWRPGSVSMTYWIVRDVLPLAELALCRTIVREELITHGVEAVYLDGCPLLPGPVDHSLQSVHLQRRAIVAVIDAHHKDLDVNLLASDLKDMGIFTTEQCQKLTSLDEKDRRHDALLYSLLAHEEPDMYHRLVKCVGQRNASIAADLQATFMDLTKPPGALSVGSSQSTYLMMDDSRRKALRQCQQDLRMLIRVNDFLPSLHVHARGFLNDVESDSIRKHKGYVKQVDELIDILVTKENKDFDHFCIILEKNGHHVSSEKLRKPAGLGLCIKESEKVWKRSLPCNCRNVTQPSCDWVTCVHLEDNTPDICQPFFLVYGLDKGSSLTVVMSKAWKNHKWIRGFILVNHSNSMTLPDGFWDSDECNQLPLYVVSQANGQVLLNLLQRLNVGEMCMSIRFETSVDDLFLAAAKDSDALQSSIGEVSSFISLENYLEEVTRVKPVVAITEVLSQLQKRERDEFLIKDETVTQFICDKVRRIMADGDFVRDFLLHMSIAYRMLSDKNRLYCEDQYSEFIEEFLGRSEQCLSKQDESQLFMVVRHFQARDFTVADIGNGSMSFFGMICDASQKLLTFTRKIYPGGHYGLKMLWIYLDLAFRSPRIAFDWRRDFVEKESIKKDMVTQDELDWLNGAIQVGLKVKLSQEMRFSGKNLVDLLVHKARWYQFVDLRAFLKMFHGTLFRNMEQVLLFIEYSHSACLKLNDWKKRSISKLGTDRKCLNVVLSEGVEFISHAVCLYGKTAIEDQKEERLLKACTTWWGSILEHALPHSNETCSAVELLSKNLKGDEQLSRLLSGLTQEFLNKFGGKMKSLCLEKFVEYYCSLSIIPIESVKVYLDSYPCQGMLDVVFERLLEHFFKDGLRCELEYHEMFQKYIMASSKHHRPPSSFLDYVLSLKTEHLLADSSLDEKQTASMMTLRSNFRQQIMAFVQEHKLSEEACTCIGNVLTDRNEFTPVQQTVLEALFKFVSFKKSHFCKSGPASEEHNIIKAVISKLCNHYKTSDSWDVPPTDLLSLYWEKLREACQLVSPTTVSLNVKWVSDNQRIICSLAIVYTRFREVRGVTSPQSASDVVKPSSDDHMKKYFEWIFNLQKLISSWQQKIRANEWTEADVEQFADLEVISSVNKIAANVCIEKLERDAKHMQQDIQELKHAVKNIVLPVHSRRRCSVLGILHKYNVGIPHPVSQLLTKCPGNFERCLLRCIHYEGREEDADFDSFCMKDLTMLHEELQQFIAQIGNAHLIDFMAHFSMHNSQIFVQYLKEQIALQQSTTPKECTVPSVLESLEVFTSQPAEGATAKCLDNTRHAVQIYHDALQATEDFLQSILLGEAPYGSLCSLVCPQGRLRTVDVDHELSILQAFQFPNVDEWKGIDGIRPILQLIPFVDYIENIHNVCMQYQITGCLQDEGMKGLLDIHSVLVSEEKRNDLNANRSEVYLEKISEILELPDRNWNALRLFAAVKDSADFHQFLKEKRFWGREGTNFFMQQHTLITAHLQHEEYNETVLNHLLVAFRYISPFLDTNQDLKQLVKEVYHSCGQAADDCSTDFVQLYTVNRNITLVRLWFSRAEGDTLENISEELKSLLSTGCFEFVIPESMDVPPSDVSTAPMFWNARDQRKLLLKYQPSPPEQCQEVTNDATPTKTWSREQIEDFTRKMAFLDEGSEDGSHLKFQKLSTIARQTFELLCELADLGYRQERLKPILCLDLEAAETLKHDLEKKLSDWRKKLKQLHSDYDKLLFFHIPKMLRMSKMLCQGDSKSEGISQLVMEVSFLFGSNKETRQQIDAALKEAVEITSEDVPLPDICSEVQLPIARLGKVLDNLFQNTNVCHSRFPKPTASSVMTSGHSLPAQLPSSNEMPRESLCTMHVGTNLTPKGIIQLVYEIYEGFPAPYEVYHCRADSTEEELILFFQRILKFTYLHFCLLDVNVLPVKLQEVLLQQHLAMERQEHHCTIHYISTGSCLLEDMPWVTVKEHEAASFKYDWKQICTVCKPLLNTNQATFSAFELVYGKAGVGKTHYIRRKMKSSKERQLTVVINESFSARNVIQQLRSLPMEPHIVLYFNFTLLQPSKYSSDVDQHLYQITMSEVERFLFDLFFLGYVEDSSSGLSFTMPSELSWACYCEVPSGEDDNPDVSCRNFVEELPILELVGTFIHIQDEHHQLEVDSDVQLVCKYLNAYDKRDDPIHGINRLYNMPGQARFSKVRNDKKPHPVRFGQDSDLPDAVCHELLARHMAEHKPVNVTMNKMYQKLFIGYMKRRCQFLERFPGLNYNQGSVCINGKVFNTSKLGSTMMKTMLKEVSGFCHPQRRSTWSSNESTRLQLIYDIKDGEGCFHLIAINVSSEDLEEFRVMGVQPPPPHELLTRKHLDRYLSSAFNLRLQEDNTLKVIDECKYVLTLDYTLKMLEIHERLECGIPVIIEGETGVGKTALVEMLLVLLRHSLLDDLRLLQDRVLDLLKRNCHFIKASEEVMASYMQLVTSLQEDAPVMLEDLEAVCSISQMVDTAEYEMPMRPFNEVLRHYVQQLILSPVLTLLDFKTVSKENTQVENKGNRKTSLDSDFPAMLQRFNSTQDSQATAGLLFFILRAQPQKMFHKLNVHAALTPKDFYYFFQAIFKQAEDLKHQWTAIASHSSVPKVMVFLDEINTSSCMGLLKEVLVDRTFFGEPIPENIFIVAACNPRRGNSVFAMERDRPYESWMRSTYNVHCLHPTIRYLRWNYGALNSQQEEQYIKAKMKMTSDGIDNFECGSLSVLILESQKLMRRYAEKELTEAFHHKPNAAAVAELVHSCVSQRDIQRVFTLYRWLLDSYSTFGKKRFSDDEECQLQERAVLVALGIVYYLRLNQKYRDLYEEDLEKYLSGCKTVKKALKAELDFYRQHLNIPSGIAKTQALLENMFCIIACCCTKIPLIIVGAPGSSKTLSFNLALANIKGEESKSSLFRDCKLFPALDPHFYQCSRHTTSVEVKTVFQRAVKRQAGFDEFKIPINCTVFMDEAGLPEEGHESLKVLHKYLDDREVSFVAITNHLLDAAKTNRAASLFRTSMSDTDVKALARDCVGCTSPEEADAKVVDVLCEPYQSLMNTYKWFKHFFGLRDFIHMIHYLRCWKGSSITPQLVLNALERNFNGCEHDQFETVCKTFLRPLESSPDKLVRRNVIEILKESLQDTPNRSFKGDQQMYNDVRYKLIIDPSEDESLPRLLLMCKILDPKKTRVFTCSDFPEDSQLQKINTIAAIRHAAVEGHTVLMSQTDDIHDSFYDLFNQHFRRIDEPDPKKEPRFYANVAIGSHSKPCRVHKDFQCVVIVRKSEPRSTPPPFLNRFEKYSISHRDFLDARLQSLPPCLCEAVRCALDKVLEFFHFVGESSFYGARKGESVESILLSILPSPDYQFTQLMQEADNTTLQLLEATGEEIEVENGPLVLLTTLINTLQRDAGFHFIKISDREVKEDAVHILSQLCGLSSDHQEIAQAILENTYSSEGLRVFVCDAVNHLHFGPALESCKDIAQESSMVITVMVQWLVLYMSKRLLQLMTAEALMLSRKGIPDWCIDAYLTHQSHFSLKELINNNLQAFHNSSSTGTASTKLMCFTRSTPNIHRLPAIYSTVPSAAEHKLGHELEVLMKAMIIDELTPLYLCKLSSVPSEQAFRVHLQSFVEKTEKRVMLLVINMQETTKRLVNHIRTMVEQVQASTREAQKLFVLLLYFPLSMVFNPCYPALFLNGWDHHYLDSVQPEPEGIVDIRQWCSVACQQRHHLDEQTRQSVIVEATESMIPSSVSIVSSRVSIGSKNGGQFNSIPTDGSHRVRRFEQLLTGPVGKRLCIMYARYWQPDDLAHYLEEAALYSKDHKSTVSITDSVKDFFKTAFYNFLAYMVNLINEDLNLDIVFNQDSNEVLDLFLQLMDLLPNLPKLADLKAYNNTWPPRQAHATIPLFPFFRRVATAMDRLLENSVEEMQNAKEAMTTDASTGSQCIPLSDTYQKKLLDTLERQLVASLHSGEIPLLKLAVTAIGEHKSLWERYWKDFMAKRFNLNVEEDKLTVELLNLTFTHDLKQLETNKRLVMLHTTAYANRINLCRLVSHLRSLQKLQKVVELPIPTMSTQSASVKFMSLVEKNPKNTDNPVTLYKFITDALFEALAGVCLNSGHEELNYCEPRIMGIWRDSYRDVTSQTSIREILFHSSSREKAYVCKLNSMAAVFLLLQVRGELDEEICNLGFQLGRRLLELYFDKELQMVTTLPLNLPEVTASFLVVVKSNPNKLNKAEMTVYLENLLTFFFSPHSVKLEDADVEWFLHHVNTMHSVRTSQNGMELSLDEVMEEDSCVSPEEQSPHMNGLSIAMAKRVLREILTHPQEDEMVPLHMFHGKARRLVAQTLLKQHNLEGQVGPYIPLVYRQHPEISTAPNPRMEQPLADVYFLVVLEHLVGEKSEDTRLETVLTKWNNVNKSLRQAAPEEMIVLQIEQQAAVQMVLQTTAQSLADSNLRVSALQSSPEIKKAVQESGMGGENSGHELVFMMHLLKHFNGPTALFRFLHDSKLGDLSFLVASYMDKLARIGEESTHLFPFMLPDAEGLFAQVYCEVKQLMTAMKTVKENKRAQKIKDIADGLDKITRSKGETLQPEPGKNVNTKRFLRMAVWLVVYYEFYSTGVTCCHLMEVIQTKQQFLGFTDNQLQILECFLLPDKMVQKPEAPLPQDPTAEILELGHDGQVRPKMSEVSTNQITDPIYDLFHPREACRNDPSDIQLRHAVANLIAVTFSLPQGSTHLWYFLFDQSELEDTYLPGFRYPVAVSPQKMFYDCGVLLNEDGQFDRPDYREHSSPLSLHSFYLLEWATFGVLCMALLTNPEAEGKIDGHIISDWQPLRHFCLVQLRQIWLFLQCNLGLSDEERSFLIMQAMYRLFESAHSENLPGLFKSPEDVRQYEQQWHYLYEARMHSLGEKLQEHSHMANHGVIKTLSVADAMYPKVPTERQFRNTLESLLGGSDPSTPKYHILAHFIDDRERLAVGSALLPDLVEMYLWLDTHLAYLLHYEDAQKLTLKDVITEASKHYETEAKHIQDLFERLKDSYNEYVTLNGGVVGTGGCVRLRHERHAKKLTDSTPVIRLLSTDESLETEQNNWLFLVMKDVVSAHNNLVQLVNSQGKDATFHCWLPSTPLTVDVREFTTSDALFLKHPQHKEQILSMIRSRCLSTITEDPSGAISVTAMKTMASRAMFDFNKLESDVVRYYLAGKPFISDVESTLRRPFCFRGNKTGSSTVTSGLAGPGCPVDLAALSQELPESCKDELLNGKKKELEADFHSASYTVLSDLVIGLRTAAGYLCQVRGQLSMTLQQETPVLEQTLTTFLSGYFGKDQPGSDVLKWELLTDKQCHALENLTVRYLYKTLEMFVGWITDCLYDFHELPFAVKRPLPVSVEKQIEEKLAENQFSSSFLEVVEELENTVSHIAHGLYREQDINPLQPLRRYLVSAQFYSEDDQTLLQLVPDEVQLQHYMYFVVQLRKLKLKLQNGCSSCADTDSSDPKVWPEMASHVWVNFTHFQDSTAAELPVSVDDPDAMKMEREVMEEKRHSDGLSPDSKTSVEAKPEVIEEPIGATARQDDDQPALSEKTLEKSTMESLLSREPSEKAKSMTTEELIEWLKTIKLSKYATVFEDEGITGEELAVFTLETLKEMGIEKDLERRKILLHFRKI